MQRQWTPKVPSATLSAQSFFVPTWYPPDFIPLAFNGQYWEVSLMKMQGIVDEALQKSEKDGYKVPHVLVYDNKSAVARSNVNLVTGRDVWWDEAVDGQPSECEVEWLDAEAPLFKVSSQHSSLPSWVFACLIQLLDCSCRLSCQQSAWKYGFSAGRRRQFCFPDWIKLSFKVAWAVGKQIHYLPPSTAFERVSSSCSSSLQDPLASQSKQLICLPSNHGAE